MENKENSEYEVLQALYDFAATVAQTLSFEKDDYFIFHSNNNIKKNWWNVINVRGKQGYIPSNYVSLVKVSKDVYSTFLNQTIEHLGKDIAKVGGGSDKQLEIMQELISHKQSLDKKKSKCVNKEKLITSKSLPSSSVVDENEAKEKPKVHPPPLRLTASESKFSVSTQPSVVDPGGQEKLKVSVSPQGVYCLVQQVREATDLSFELSRVAVGVIAEGLLDAAGCMESIIEALRGQLTAPPAVLEQTPDARHLRSALSHLAACHDDAQQRSWQLWDDEHTIIQNINLLNNILENADPEISRLVLKSDGYNQITILSEYYQMEDRWVIRERLIEAFTIMSSLDKTIISILLNSILPMEIAREMQSSLNSSLKNPVRINKLARLLSVIFSTGEAMPITHLEHLGIAFVKVILNEIESERESETSDIMLTLLLAYNLQFKPQASTNITVQALSEVDSVKTFTEKILLLINREEDPIQGLKVHSNTYHSVLKLFMDLFSRKTAAKLFYTNDIRVLVDIITRQVTDLSPQNEKRTEYLGLCKMVLISCDSNAFEHRIDELRDRFSHILTDETPPVEVDRKLVRQIILGLPQYFGEFQSLSQVY